MCDGVHHLEARLARAALLAALLVTAVGGLSAMAAYAWHVYRLIVLDR